MSIPPRLPPPKAHPTSDCQSPLATKRASIHNTADQINPLFTGQNPEAMKQPNSSLHPAITPNDSKAANEAKENTSTFTTHIKNKSNFKKIKTKMIPGHFYKIQFENDKKVYTLKLLRSRANTQKSLCDAKSWELFSFIDKNGIEFMKFADNIQHCEMASPHQ